MPSTTFIPRQTLITAEWLNEVNDFVFNSEQADLLEAISLQEDPGEGGFWPDITAGAKIIRARDRLFVGPGAAFTGNLNTSQGSFIPTPTDGANWAIRDSYVLSATDKGLMAIVGFACNDNIDTGSGKPTENIGVAGFAIGNKANKSSHALYSDLQFEEGSYGYGVEFALKNKTGISYEPHSYFAQFKVIGSWYVPGGDPSYGGVATENVCAAIALGGNNTLGRQFNKGIVFFQNSLNGTDGVTGTGVAMEMAKGHELKWRNASGLGFTIRSDNVSGASDTYLISEDSLVRIAGRLEADIFQFSHNTSSVNYGQFVNSSTGNPLTLRALGADTDVGFNIRTKGTGAVRFTSQGTIDNNEFRVGGINSAPVNYLHAYGTNTGGGIGVLAAAGTDSAIDVYLFPKGTSGRVRFGTHAAIGAETVTGYIEIRDISGNIRKLAVVS